jgi:hypothetical protein
MISTLHRHTHCQVAQANAQTQTWQRVWLSQRTTDRQLARKTEGQQLTAVWQKWRFSPSYDNFVGKQTVVLHINICGKKRHLRQAANRWQKF